MKTLDEAWNHVVRLVMSLGEERDMLLAGLKKYAPCHCDSPDMAKSIYKCDRCEIIEKVENNQ